MDYAASDSSGTDDDLPPSHLNRSARGRMTENGRGVAPSYPRVQNDMEIQIHQLEKEAYSSVLQAFKAQSDAITWIRIEDIVDAVASSSLEEKFQGRNEVMARLIMKSLQNNDAVFMRVSRSIYLAARGVVLDGSGIRGRGLADAALQRVGASMLLDLVVKAAEALIVMANISVCVHMV